MARATRTLNPLHFEDLEPHRFEDLVRQLAYDFRSWASIEATGRGGADDGIDIRAFEQGRTPLPEESDDDDPPLVSPGRQWIIQCKREKCIGPTQVRRYVEESVQGPDMPYGFILAAACDFSKKAYDAFRLALIGTGVQEFQLWGKAELEDMLFQPKNDHLLFAYFGISLQTRKRTKQSELKSMLALRKRVGRVIGGPTKRVRTEVLLRIADDDRYPDIAAVPDFDVNPPWAIHQVQCLNMRDNLVLELRRHFAYLDSESGEWDALDHSWPTRSHRTLYGQDRTFDPTYAAYHAAWQQRVPQENQAELVILTILPLSRVLGVDEEGDLGHPLPILYVDATSSGTLLDPLEERLYLEQRPLLGRNTEHEALPEQRIPFFKDFKLEEGETPDA
ncbi:restriction endonuclease [Deinococcus aquaedulcis]|uniref:restriction endonuclease n=1 Tax=Deinococcus aquaedulcis TaxID=2840455 RepID=UPI001C82DA49|nr:restriction endonuclease [Deinococcus aquaedulcis]